jgi:hypothetical protein
LPIARRAGIETRAISGILAQTRGECHDITRIAVALAAPLLLALPLAARRSPTTTRSLRPRTIPPPPAGWHVARTAWGDPDLRGMWPVDYLTPTPRERPAEIGTRTEWTEDEYTSASARPNSRRT